jgi:mycothiol synthase
VTHTITWQETLTPAEIADVDAMLNRVSDADGVSSLSEHTYLHILAGGAPGEQHALARLNGHIVGYAFVDDGAGELLVDPGHREQGIGRRLLDAVLRRDPGIRIWAHGQLPAAHTLAVGAGFVGVRQLCRYTRSLTDIPDRDIPARFTVRPFTADDAPEWLRLNAEAFVDLPDQGGWTRVDLDKRLRQPWFDPQGFLLAFDEVGLAGFHWTKVHHGSLGEVYVLGVAPRTQGTGLGMGLTCAGLRYLQSQGLSEVMLYVDTSNTAAVAMYTRLGFRRADCDVQYARNA